MRRTLDWSEMMILQVAGGLGNGRQAVGTREHSFCVLQELLEGYLQVLHIYVCISPGTTRNFKSFSFLAHYKENRFTSSGFGLCAFINSAAWRRQLHFISSLFRWPYTPFSNVVSLQSQLVATAMTKSRYCAKLSATQDTRQRCSTRFQGWQRPTVAYNLTVISYGYLRTNWKY